MKLGYNYNTQVNCAKKISAIKAYRSLTGMGLKESKDEVEEGAITGILELTLKPMPQLFNVTTETDVINVFAKEGVVVTALPTESEVVKPKDPRIHIRIEFSMGSLIEGEFPLSKLPAIYQGLKKIIG